MDRLSQPKITTTTGRREVKSIGVQEEDEVAGSTKDIMVSPRTH